MIVTSLRANQLPAPEFEWYGRYLSAFEACNVDAYLSYLAKDCVVQTNSRVPYYGRDGLSEALERYFDAYSVTHELLNIFGQGGQFGAEMLTHYTPRGGGESIIIPTASFYDLGADGLLQSIRHYVDDRPLSG
jgi:hypothetical protein